jgi:zinc transport system substrate-binding protein
LLILLFTILATGPWSSASWAKTQVYVSIPPQLYFLHKIGGELVDAKVMVPRGASPATYEPSPRQMAGLAKARAYFAIDVPFERAWLPRFASANPEMPVFRTDDGIAKRRMAAHDHGHHDGHGHGGIPDPHVWLSPALAKTIAQNTAHGLSQIDPANTRAYTANLESFQSEIDALDMEIRNVLAGLQNNNRSFMVFHPSWGYFADAYGLTQIPIETEGKEPGPRELTRIIEHGRELGVPVVFVQPQFSDKSARLIAQEMGARVAVLDPLAENWAENLASAARAFKEALK